MLSVKDNENTIIIKNSRFIGLIYHVDTMDEVDSYLKNIKNIYKDATHYCYAYILGGVNKCSDDGEPAGTAGMPILQVLQKNNLDHVLCIVVRYFGKILLGAGGLVRAYSKSTSECLVDHIIELEKGYNIDISFKYDQVKQIDYILKNVKVKNKKYDDVITYNLDVNMEIYNNLLKSKMCEISINRNIYL